MKCYQCKDEIEPDGMIYEDGDGNRICLDCLTANLKEAGFMQGAYFDRWGNVWS